MFVRKQGKRLEEEKNAFSLLLIALFVALVTLLGSLLALLTTLSPSFTTLSPSFTLISFTTGRVTLPSTLLSATGTTTSSTLLSLLSFATSTISTPLLAISIFTNRRMDGIPFSTLSSMYTISSVCASCRMPRSYTSSLSSSPT